MLGSQPEHRSPERTSGRHAIIAMDDGGSLRLARNQEAKPAKRLDVAAWHLLVG